MTIDVESKARLFVERVGFFVERFEPGARRVWEITVSAVKLAVGSALTLVGGGFLILAGYKSLLSDAVLLAQDGRNPPPPLTDIRGGLLLIGTVGLGFLIWGLHRLHDWAWPHNGPRVAELECQVSSLETELFAAEQFAGEAEQRADKASQFAADREWATHAVAAVADVFKIDGVLEAARRACRKALHP